MLNKIITTIEKYKMLDIGDKIIVGVSGGADSMSLLHALYSIKEKYNLELIVAHINHGIRGEEADRDEALVKAYCERLMLKYFAFNCNIKEYAKEMRMTEEEAGRKFRYDKFKELLIQNKANKIAVAHNKNDNVETVLINLIRGAGTKGLTGISAVNDYIIRPLIDCSRDEIEQYCKENAISYVIDSTNKENIYTRNKIRNQLIPFIKQNINENVINNIYRATKILEEEDTFLNKITDNAFNEIVISIENDSIKLDIAKLSNYDMVLIKRIIRKALLAVNNNLKNISLEHINDILDIINSQSGKQIYLPNNIIVKKDFSILSIFIGNLESNIDFEYKLEGLPKQITHEGLSIKLDLVDASEVIQDSDNIKYFDHDKINIDALSIRNRKEGDYIYLKSESDRQKLKKFFTNNKIPIIERNKLPILVANNNVLWIIGYRVSPYFAVTDKTKEALRVEVIKN